MSSSSNHKYGKYVRMYLHALHIKPSSNPEGIVNWQTCLEISKPIKLYDIYIQFLLKHKVDT